MAKRKMKESMDNITNIKDSTAALSPEMQLAKERAKDKDEEFEKIVLSKDGILGASKQPTPDKPKWSLDESLFDKPISLNESEYLNDNEIKTFANSAGAERRPLRSEDVQDLDICNFETSADLLDYASDIANEEFTSKEELQVYLDNQDYSDGSEIMYYVVFDGEVLIDDTDYFEVEMWDYGNDEVDIDSVLDSVRDGSIDSTMIVDFLSDHETAFEDACEAFDVFPDDFDEQCEALNQEDPEDLVNWISEHELLWTDFCNYINRELNQFNESLKKKGTKRITEAIDPTVKKVRDFLYYEIADFVYSQLPCQYVASKIPEYQEFDWPEEDDPEVQDKVDFFIDKLADALIPEFFMPEVLDESLKESISDDLKEVNLNKFNIGTLPYQVVQFLWDLSENGKLDDRSLERQAKNILELINRNMSNESLKRKTMKRYMIEEMNNEITDVDAYNESRDAKLVKRYKSILGLDEDFEITEENLDDWALKHACSLEGANYDRAKAAVLGLKFEGYK